MRRRLGLDVGFGQVERRRDGLADERGEEARQHTGQPPRAVESALPEPGIQRRDFDLTPPTRRMDELIGAEIDADMRKREASGVEEDEVARLQLGQLDLLAEMTHVLRGARKRHTGHLLEHITDEPAAIEARFGRAAAPLVANADEAERGCWQDPAPTVMRSPPRP